MTLHFAPIQGHTDAAYRHFHAGEYDKLSSYYSPFIRLERGEIRTRDRNDIVSPLNDITAIIPQIIFRDEAELLSLVKIIKDLGFNEIDLNLGCPFPLQTGHGRGAAAIANPEIAKAIEKVVSENEDISFSVKMRLGLKEPDEWRHLLPTLNKISLKHIAVHPRIAKQQYKGDLYSDEFENILNESKNSVIFNGDIKTPEDINNTVHKFPNIKGIMIGRGLLGRPSLLAEFTQGEEWDKNKRIEKILTFHRRLFEYYNNVLCGDTQILSKIKPFWEYAEEEIGRKAWKMISKASNIAKYHSALAMIEEI